MPCPWDSSGPARPQGNSGEQGNFGAGPGVILAAKKAHAQSPHEGAADALLASQGVDLFIAGETAELQLGEQELAVAEHLEGAAGAGLDLDVFGSKVGQSGSRTESSRLVVSGDAVFDAEFHGADATEMGLRFPRKIPRARRP